MNKPNVAHDEQLKRFIDERNDSFANTTKKVYPDLIVNNVNIGKICRYWYHVIYNNASEYIKQNNDILLSMVRLIDVAYEYGLNLDDKLTDIGRLWDFLLKYYYELGLSYRLTMDETSDEKVRLGTRN